MSQFSDTPLSLWRENIGSLEKLWIFRRKIRTLLTGTNCAPFHCGCFQKAVLAPPCPGWVGSSRQNGTVYVATSSTSLLRPIYSEFRRHNLRSPINASLLQICLSLVVAQPNAVKDPPQVLSIIRQFIICPRFEGPLAANAAEKARKKILTNLTRDAMCRVVMGTFSYFAAKRVANWSSKRSRKILHSGFFLVIIR